MTDYTLELELEQRQDTTDNLAVHSGNEEAMLSHGGGRGSISSSCLFAPSM